MNQEQNSAARRRYACFAAVACGLVAAGPVTGVAAEPPPAVFERFFVGWRTREPCRGEPAGSECLRVTLVSPARRGDALALLVARPDEPGALEPELLPTGMIVSVDRGPVEPGEPPPPYREAALSVRWRFPPGTHDAVVAVSGDVRWDRVGTVLEIGSGPDAVAYRRRFARAVRKRWLDPIEAKTGHVPDSQLSPMVFRLSPPGQAPAWDVVTFEVPKLGSFSFGVDLRAPKRPVLFAQEGLAGILSLTDLDADGTFEVGLAWAPHYFGGDWEVRMFDGKRLGRRKVLMKWDAD